MGRPRKHNVNIPGLSPYFDSRTNKVYWRYKHPVTGKFHGLGTDEKIATEIAIEANTRLAEQQMRNILKIKNELHERMGGSSSVTTFITRYKKIQEERYSRGEIKLNTLKQKNSPLKVLDEHLGLRSLDQITVKDIVNILDEYKEKGHNRMGQIFRKVAIDVFKEAQQLGDVPVGFNPAEAAKKPHVKISRQRLTFDEWKIIYASAEKENYFLQRGMLLAIITGQRLADICNMKFSDVEDNYLLIEQSKTGAKIALPLHLKCYQLGMSLGEVISLCRDRVLSPYLLHHHHAKGTAKRGGKVKPGTLTVAFSKARDEADYDWSKNGTPPSFHEQRSLSERLYREQGIDTQILLGHTSKTMTDRYNDSRGKEWKKLVI
ncbi:TPA: phage integrase Arm DNA-binding domain-containing protein [Klebsiella pneumoniae]|uniref:phage integrase Arm DNA-binding domain-containing protein n=1 Tax=Klebsiella pneumoniae TaxID=573 RepID=UPI001D0B903F|nr:phage integrase Arm DNA-binding domain-containing protein [Klebsiella pneumoniae]MCB8061241.1 phage integrase Arm DNA-binding domain-containing protein [Klebsiella pneumoniae]MCG5589987.1 phage integrase Arm DNA-binding domain-containing protein [Klebsiella pneumoniae]HBR5010128.1 phage integrase Arm DNA-binding domain-containing protein [Klebsiella pneumoniae]HBY4397480.1 integrase [Klebsiella pneumoniae]HDY9101552.1 phage integrase Arm DNA-binding domain-containing protein [Klebsiella pne